MRFLKFFVAPLFLIAFWLIFPIIINPNDSLSVVSTNYNKDSFKSYSDTELYKGQKVSAEFKAKEDNLGIIAVRFNTFGRINGDYLTFRVKEKEKEGWYYETRYRVDQFQPNDFFTFGFPVVNNSKEKNFLFELQSFQGSPGDAIALSTMEPILKTKYQFSKAQLIENKKTLLTYSFKKIYYSFADSKFFIFSLSYLLPFIFYISFVVLKKKTLFSLLSIALVTFLGIFTVLSSLTTLFLLALWIFLIILNKMNSSISFFLAFVFLLIVPLMLLTGNKLGADNLAIWTYYFLVIGTCQTIYELTRRPKNLISIYSIFNLKIFKIGGNFIKLANNMAYDIFAYAFRSLTAAAIYILRFFSLSSHSKLAILVWVFKMSLLLALLAIFIYNKVYPVLINEKFVPGSNSGLYVSKIEPAIARHADKVVLFGGGFNWDKNEPVRLYSQYGEIKPDTWDDNKIIVSVPLNYKIGNVTFWVERPMPNRNSAQKSNVISIKLIDRNGKLSREDYDYFHQVKFLESETLKVNEFRNYKYGKYITAFILKLL